MGFGLDHGSFLSSLFCFLICFAKKRRIMEVGFSQVKCFYTMVRYLCYSVPDLKYSRWKKKALFENSINQIPMKTSNCTVMCYSIIICTLSPNFKVELIFYGF